MKRTSELTVATGPDSGVSAVPPIAEIFGAYADGVFTLGVRMLRDRHLAEDLVQDTFLQIIRRLSSYRGEGTLGGWVYRIAYRKALEHLRRRSDVPVDPADLTPHVDPAAGPESGALARELAGVLDAAIGVLAPLERAAFVLRDIEGLSTADTAMALEIGESAVKMRLMRARQHLRATLEDYL